MIIADAVSRQDEWRRTVTEWPILHRKLAIVMPDRDWTSPVWVDADIISRMESGERAGIANATAIFQADEDERERQEADQAGRWLAQHGLVAMAEVLGTPFAQPTFGPAGFPAKMKAAIHERIENERLSTLAEIRPVATRLMVKSMTVRGAVEAFLATQAARVDLRTAQAIDLQTFKTKAARLRGVFGQSSNVIKPPVRTTPIDFDASLASVDKATIERFAAYWHKMPSGVRSERRVKNVLESAREFFEWCSEQDEYGWKLPSPCLRLLTADDVRREAVAFDPAILRKIVNSGGPRIRLYTLFGLCCGYYQQDIADIAGGELYSAGDDVYVKRFRSKESRPKRGRAPMKVRHWIAPEFAALIESERGCNAIGTLFNSDRGTPLNARTVEGVWDTACDRAAVRLMFSQLRKIGSNAIKRLARDVSIGERWLGHALGVSDSYDDGIFAPVNDAERLWADELRKCKIFDV